MERPKGSDIKSYCYKSKDECDIVLTGVNLLEFWVCRNCKYEVSEALKNSREDIPISKNSDEDLSDFWGMNKP